MKCLDRVFDRPCDQSHLLVVTANSEWTAKISELAIRHGHARRAFFGLVAYHTVSQGVDECHVRRKARHLSQMLSSRWKLVTQKDSVAGAALLQAAAHALHLDGEPAIAQALLEFSIIPGRPDGQHTADLESRASGG